MYAFGSAEKGQLGNGKTGAHIVQAGKVVFDAETEPRELLKDILSTQSKSDTICSARQGTGGQENSTNCLWPAT